MKVLKIFVTTCFLFFSINSLAAKNDSLKSNDYNSGAYDSEGRILVKIRGFGMALNGAHKNLPSKTNSTAAPNSKFAKNGFGIENANTLFFTDNIAAELALGIAQYNVSTTAINNIYNNYGNIGYLPVTKKRSLIGIPITFSLQYHIAPFGGIRPYLGAGYNYTYFTSQSSEYKVNSSHGVAIQLGTDIVMTDDTVVNFDVKKYYSSSKVVYKRAFLNTTKDLSCKVRLDPIVVSVGIGFKI